jgi:Holliday junction resolvase RusA-like endonuclease
MMPQRLTVLGRLPGLNEIIAASKQHYQVYAKEKKVLTHKVESLARAARLRTISSRCAVRFLWFEANRRRDQDNICAGQKFILDGLVAAGVLPDDGWQWISGIEHRFSIDRDNPRVEIDIIEEPT